MSYFESVSTEEMDAALARIRELEAALAAETAKVNGMQNVVNHLHDRARKAESERDEWKGRHLALAEDRLRIESERDEAVEFALHHFYNCDTNAEEEAMLRQFLARVGRSAE